MPCYKAITQGGMVYAVIIMRVSSHLAFLNEKGRQSSSRFHGRVVVRTDIWYDYNVGVPAKGYMSIRTMSLSSTVNNVGDWLKLQQGIVGKN